MLKQNTPIPARGAMVIIEIEFSYSREAYCGSQKRVGKPGLLI
jgi:hypothetical protein